MYVLRGFLIAFSVTLIGINDVKATTTGPTTPIEDRMFIIDHSGSIDDDTLRLELDLVIEYICGAQSLDPATSPFGISVMFFDDVPSVLIPYTVVTNALQAQALCDVLSNPYTSGGGTLLVPALDLAIFIFENQSLASNRKLTILTDGVTFDIVESLDRATTLRTLAMPVRICTMDFSPNCGFVINGSNIANTVDAPTHDPSQPIGAYGCTNGLSQPNIICDDCTCSTDCNANGIFDLTDILDGTSADLDGDFLPDECEDCDENDIYDARELVLGLAFDCNENAILDSCDLLATTSIDCDGNAVPDECEDCNLNGIADPCDVDGTRFLSSLQLSPIGLGSPVSHTFTTPPPALGDVAFEFKAIADLGGHTKYVDVTINGDYYGRVLNQNGTPNCPPVPETDQQLIIPMAEYNALLGSGDLTIDLVADGSLPFECNGSLPWVSVTLIYQATPFSEDVNTNGNPDECDRTTGDNNLDGVVNVDDLLNLLAAWGVCSGSCPEDTNLDGAVDVEDLLTLLANWG
ncbi:MAG: hypothetical protein O7G85_03755 [Planctomycetota bacterium]|nr:hypothetical protein [Planctomycetota bacterium]